MSADTPATMHIDVRGFVCPSSLLIALRELNKYREALRHPGFKVEFLVDNHESTNRICEAIKSMGYDFQVTEADNSYSIVVSRTRALEDGNL